MALLNDSLDSVMFSESKYWDTVKILSAYRLPETHVYETGNNHLVPHTLGFNNIRDDPSIRKMTANLQCAISRQDTRAALG